jgi:hypothetical protein
MKPVDSSHLFAVGHDPEQNKLRVQFRDGSVYEYDDFTQEHHEQFMNAPSHGKHFAQNIRKGPWNSRRVA